ncbi:lytic murein transglycosylase [Salinimonas sediminis]|uniref:Lytic murein transglycosylase n=2 Tax=Salinimonas sediminis TaxID=2303538 RepID=A0A346NIE1_9ALTE|nr:lytic murein transglycosylase [Salinimonas sediminis]
MAVMQYRKQVFWANLVLFNVLLLGIVSTPRALAQLLPDAGEVAMRAQFERVENALRTTSRTKLDTLDDDIAALKSYPLYPYLVRQRLYRQMDITHRPQIETFLATYNGQPVSYGMRGSWLRYLSERNDKSAFLANYREGLGATITCQYLRYQLQGAANPKYWLNKVKPIWLSGQSQPNECDPIFRQWQQAGMLTEELILGRIRKAADSGNPRLVPYLKGKLPADAQYLADLWLAVRNDPAYILNFRQFPLSHVDEEARMLAFGLEKLAWQDADKAVRAYHHWVGKKLFSTDNLHAIHRAIALSKAIDHQSDALSWLEKADVDGAEDDVKRWHMAFLLREQHWERVLKLIEQAPPRQQKNDNYLYWRARSLAALGRAEQAEQVFSQLAGQRHYYGFMASARVGAKPALMHQPVERVQQQLTAVAELPAAQRAYEFLQLGRQFEARREWHYLLTHIDSDKLTAAALVASEWGWYDQSIISFTRSGYLDDVEKRFPLAYASQFDAASKTYDVHPAFAMAIARRESSFMADAVSPAGATGLMQLMPGTAQYLAKKNLNRSVLFEPERNLQFGVQYLRYLGDKLANNPVLVSASYNAGWRKVLEWLPQSNDIATDIWIENIPYKETRRYVKAVMAYRYIYEYQLGTPSELFQQLATDAIPASSQLDESGRQLQLAPD